MNYIEGVYMDQQKNSIPIDVTNEGLAYKIYLVTLTGFI